MRITLVCPYDPMPRTTDARQGVVGGVERVFAEVSPRLAARGHDVTVLCTTDGPASQARESGITMVRARRQATLMRDPVARLAAHIPRDAEVVHVAATYPFTTPSVLRRSRALGIPSVLDFHFEPTPGSRLGRAAHRLYRASAASTYGLASAVLVRSLAYGRSAPSLRQVPRARWRVVPNGIDPLLFCPTHKPPKDHFLFVGRLVPYKGVAVLLDALALLHPDASLLVAGDGPLRPNLEAKARALGVDARFLGRVEDHELPDLYREARLTVLPSVTRQEAFGISLLESMACGTPVVASNLPGVAEVARLGGRVAPPGDPRALATQLRRALESPGERGLALGHRIHARYSWDAVVDRLLDVYREVAARRGG